MHTRHRAQRPITRARRRTVTTVIVGALLAAGLAPASATAAHRRDDTVLYQRSGDTPGSYFGWAVSELTDVDDDGVTDWITGAPVADDEAGFTVVYSGADGTVLHTFPGEPGSYHGYAMADAGDTDGDGVADIVAGAPGAGPGYAHVYSGATGQLLLTLAGEQDGDFFGAAVGGAGDVDRDHHADVLVGAPQSDARGTDSGRAYVFSGADGSLLRTYEAEGAGDLFGSGTAGAGDLDRDGIAEHIIGAPDAGDGDRGEVYVRDGRSGAERFEFHADATGVDLGWFFVAGLRDVDGDRIPDLYAGDFNDEAKGAGTGRAYVWSGRRGRLIRRFAGDGPGQGLGPGRGAGDVNGDHHEDVVIGSYTSSDGAPGAGKAQVFSGVSGRRLRTIVSDREGENLGFDAVGLGDVDGDGAVDFLISAATGDTVYLYAGSRRRGHRPRAVGAHPDRSTDRLPQALRRRGAH